MGRSSRILFDPPKAGHSPPARTNSQRLDDESNWGVVCITSPGSDLTKLGPGRLLIDTTGLGQDKSRSGLRARLEQLSNIPPFLQRVLVLSHSDVDALNQEAMDRIERGDRAEDDGVWRNVHTGYWVLSAAGRDKAVQAMHDGSILFKRDQERPWEILILTFPEHGSPWRNVDGPDLKKRRLGFGSRADVIITHASTSHEHKTLNYIDCALCRDLQMALDDLKEKPKLVVSPHIKAEQAHYVSKAYQSGKLHRIRGRSEPVTYVNLLKEGVAEPEVVLMCDSSKTALGKPKPKD